MTDLKNLIACDDGFGDTDTAKFAVDDKGKVFIHCQRRPSFLVSGTHTDLDGAICIDIGDSTFTAPEKMKNAGQRIDIFNDDYPGSIYNAALIAAACHAHSIDITKDSVLVSGLPVHNFYDLDKSSFKLEKNALVARKKDKLSAFESSAFSAMGRTSYNLTQDNHYIVSEAAGVLIDILYSDTGIRRNDWIFDGLDSDAFVLTVDMGSRTTDLCGLTHNLSPVRSTLQTIVVGLNDVHSRFRDFLLAEEGLCHSCGLSAQSLSDDKVRKIFQEGYVIPMRTSSRDRISVQKFAERAFTSVVRDDIVPKISHLRDDLSRVAAIVIAGGGATIGGYLQQSLRIELEVDNEIAIDKAAQLKAGDSISNDTEMGRKILCAPRPEFANVRGFIKHLAFVKLGLTDVDVASTVQELPRLSR
jgi:hypothetical protein